MKKILALATLLLLSLFAPSAVLGQLQTNTNVPVSVNPTIISEIYNGQFNENPVPLCSDTDVGRMPPVAGMITVTSRANPPTGIRIFQDKCTGNTLREFFCEAATGRFYADTDCGAQGCHTINGMGQCGAPRVNTATTTNPSVDTLTSGTLPNGQDAIPVTVDGAGNVVIQVPICTDSDGGNNVMVYGTTMLTSPENTRTETDTCYSTTAVTEYACYDYPNGTHIITRTNGDCPINSRCVNGACTAPTETTQSTPPANTYVICSTLKSGDCQKATQCQWVKKKKGKGSCTDAPKPAETLQSLPTNAAAAACPILNSDACQKSAQCTWQPKSKGKGLCLPNPSTEAPASTPSTPQTRCEIVVSSCPLNANFNGLNYVGTYTERNVLEANSNQSRCMQRAQEYYNWCNSTDPIFVHYYVNGAIVEAGIHPLPIIPNLP